MREKAGVASSNRKTARTLIFNVRGCQLKTFSYERRTRERRPVLHPGVWFRRIRAAL